MQKPATLVRAQRLRPYERSGLLHRITHLPYWFWYKTEIEHLPAYSPQLNPAERFFQELRRELKNKVFESYEEVEKAVIEAVKPYLKDKQKVKSITCYGWLQNTPT